MADKQISDLTSASAMTDGSLFVIEQGGAAKSANWGMVKNYISPGVAAQYSSSATYNVGDYVIYNGQLYRCTTAITTAESWTAAHWQASVISDDVASLEHSLITNEDALKVSIGVMPVGLEFGRRRQATSGNTISNTTKEYDNELLCCKFPCSQGDVVTIKGAGDSGLYRLYCFANSNDVSLDIADSNLPDEKYTVTAPANTAYCVVNVKSSSNSPYVYVGKLIDYWKPTMEINSATLPAAIDNATGTRPVIFKQGYLRTFSDEDPDEYVNNENYICAKVSCSAGDKLHIIGKSSSDSDRRLWAFYTSAGAAVSYAETTAENADITVPATAAYCLINILASYSGACAYVGESIKYIKTETTQAEKNLAKTINNIHGIQTVIFQVGKHRNSTDGDPGIVEDDPAFMCAKLDCVDGDTITITGNGSSGLYRLVCFYESDGTYITASNVDLTGTTVHIAPANSAYCWINVLTSSPEIYAYKGVVGMTNIPDYYRSHLDSKIASILSREDSIGENNDNFIFLSDYHWQGNAGNSLSLVKDIIANTGITKLFFGGDAGRSSVSKYEAAKTDAKVYQMMWDSAPNFYGVLGNHEWNDHQDETHEASQQTNTYNRNGVVNFYLRREQKLAEVMSEEGNYYVDNAGSKIRYFFIQTTGQARVTNTTCRWLINQLNLVPDGYYVVLITHAAFDGWAHLTNPELYYGDRCRMSVIRLSQILGGYKTKSSGTVNELADYYDETGSSPYVTGSIQYDFTGAHGSPLCIIAGHMHKDKTLTESGIRIILTTTDAYDMNDDTLVTRTQGTVTEQAFDVFQVDINAGKIYATRIGGGSDRVFDV